MIIFSTGWDSCSLEMKYDVKFLIWLVNWPTRALSNSWSLYSHVVCCPSAKTTSTPRSGPSGSIWNLLTYFTWFLHAFCPYVCMYANSTIQNGKKNRTLGWPCGSLMTPYWSARLTVRPGRQWLLLFSHRLSVRPNFSKYCENHCQSGMLSGRADHWS